MASDKQAAHSSLLKKYRRAFFGEFTEAIFAAVLVAIVLRVFLVAVYRVPTDSMAPTLIPGDFILGWKTSYGIRVPFTSSTWAQRLPKRGDVVAFRIPGDVALYVKRVIGLPGDRVAVENGKVSINDVYVTLDTVAPNDVPLAIQDELLNMVDFQSLDLQRESSLSGADENSTHVVMRRRDATEADFLAPIIVPPGEVFLMGDFRSESVDSRQWGAIPLSAIESRVAWVAISLHTSKLADENPAVPVEQATLKPVGKFRWGRLFQQVR